MRRCILVACMALAVFTGFALAGAGGDKEGAKSADIERILSVGHEPSQVMDHLDVLCNRIGPRLTSSDNLTNACEWARDRFASFGIDNARLEQWGEFPVGFDRGPWFGHVIEPEAKSLDLVTAAWSAGTKGVVRGKAVLAPTNKKELDEAKEKGTIAGAWVILPRMSPAGGGAARKGGQAAGAAGPEAEFRSSLRTELEAAKAAGVVTSVGSNELLLTSGNYHLSWDKLPTLPSVGLLRKDVEQITGWIKEGKPVTLEFDIRNYFKKGPIKLYNVIADIVGSEKPEEYVIVGGHIDSWDGATGATDNGTGCATTLEAARLLMKAGVKPKRTIRFMLWSGEEQGLLGSKAYVKAHKDLMPKISAVLVHDGGTNYLSGIGATEAILSDFEQVFTPVKELDPKFKFAVSKVAGLRGGGSDHASFLDADVPGFFWGQRGGTAKYQHTHHTQFDTYDAAIPDYQKHSALVVAMGAYGIANLDHLLSREKMKTPGGGGGFGRRGGVGARFEDMTVTEITEGSAAAKAGIKEGDEILKVDGVKVGDIMEFFGAFREGGPKKIVTVRCAGKEIELTLTREAPPEAEQKKAAPQP